MERKDEQNKDKIITDTKVIPIQFVLHWPIDKRLSVWHFRTGTGLRIHLKFGWNIFGRRSCNHIEIKEPQMKSTEFVIRVLGNEFLLILYDVNGNLTVNGKRIRGETIMLHNRAKVGVIVDMKKVIYFEFRNEF